MDFISQYDSCSLCPRGCRVNRHTDADTEYKLNGDRPHALRASHRDNKSAAGFCGCGDTVKAARAALHQWEEPWISGIHGSGAVFFTGCTLRCCFCQNYNISQEGLGKEISISQLAGIFLRLQDEGAHNINLVTATQYLPSIISALDSVKHRLTIPVVYNCGGYERVEVVKALKDYIDIWLPDLKYHSPELSARYSKAPDYFEKASAAIAQMVRQTGTPEFACYTEAGTQNFDAQNPAPQNPVTSDSSSCTLMTKGVIIRHMVLPGAKDDSIRLLHWIKDNLPEGKYYVSLMSQYTPFYKSAAFPELNRRITSYEYDKVIDTAIELGLTNGFMQEKSSAKEEYTPPFNLEGIE